MKRLMLFICAIIAGMTVAAATYHPPLDFEAVQTSVVAEQVGQVELPNDVVSQAKFPDEPKDYVNAVSAINDLVNRSMTYQEDQAQYGKPEWFVMLPESMRGDCEDYAITKMYFLSVAGLELPTRARLTALVVVDSKGKMYGHMVLEVLLPNGSVAVLDNRYDHLMTRRELVGEGYRFQNW